MIFLYFTFLFIFLVMNQSLYVFGGDSAEFSLIARTFSVAHPPGYPFYSVLINIVNLIVPGLTTPWRIALISSFSSVLSSYILYKLLTRFKCSVFASLLSSTLFVFLFPVWLYSEIPEVFTLSNLLSITITFFLFAYLRNKKNYYLYLVSFLFGLSVSHHHIFVLFIPAWIYLLKQKQSVAFLRNLTKKNIALIVFLFIVGFSFYLYPSIASRLSPPLDWENAQTLEGSLRLITRSTYGTFKAYKGSSGNILNQMFDIFTFFIFILHDFRIIGLILISLGSIRIFRINRNLFNFFCIALVTHLFFLFYTNFVLYGSFTLAMYERFLIPTYLLLVIPLGFGMAYAIEIFRGFLFANVKNALLRPVTLTGFYLFLIGYAGIIMIQNYQVIKKIPRLDLFATYAKNLLDTPPKNAIFFVGADNSHFTAAYYHFAEKYRKDLKFVFINFLDKDYYRKTVKKKYPELQVPEPYVKGKDLAQFVEKNAKYGVYFDNPMGASWKPYGFLWKYYPNDASAASDSARLVDENTYLWEHVYRIPRLNKELKKILHLNVVEDHYINSYLTFSKLLFATKNYSESEIVMNNILKLYRKDDIKTKMILVNQLVFQKKCQDAKKYLDQPSLAKALNDYALLPSLKNYFDACDRKNALSKKVNELININRKARKSTLKEL